MDIAEAVRDAVRKTHNSTFYYGLTSKYICKCYMIVTKTIR